MGISRDINIFSPNQYEDVFYEAAIVAQRAPTVNDKYELGKVWIDNANDDAYFMTSVTAGNAVWINAGGGAGTFTAVTATTGNITADAGNIVATLGDLEIAAGAVTFGALGAGTLRSSAAGLVSVLADGANGEVLIGTTGGAAAWSTLTAGGGITITEAAGVITIANPGATGVTLTCTDANVVGPDGAGNWDLLGYDANITTDGSVANTVSIRLADAVTTVGALTAGVDLNMTTGDCTISANTDGAQTIYLHANGGVTETIDIYADQGTDPASVYVHSDDGGLTLAAGLASADAINIAAASGGVDVDGALTISIASSKNASDAIVLDASAGGIDISSSGGAAEDIDITASSSINLVSTEDDSEAIYLHANGGTGEAIHLHSDLGTGVASINLETDVGGITLVATGNATNDAINLSANAGGIDIDGALQINVASAQAAADAIVIDASDAAGGIDLDYGSGGFTIDGANGALVIQTGTGSIDLGSDAAAKIITIGNVTGATQVSIDSGTAGIGLTSTGAGDITIDSSDTVLIDSAGILELNSSAGVISIANDDIDQNVNISTDGVRILTLGSANTTASVVVNSGTTESSFAANATDHTTKIGSVTGTSATTAQSGTGAFTVTAGGIFDLNATDAVTIDSSAGTIGIGVDDIDQAINIGTVGERVVTVGNIVGVTGIALNSGTAGITMASTGAGDITLDSADTVLIDSAGVLELNSSAGVINIANDDVDQHVNISIDGERTLTLGSSNGAAGVVVNAGTTTSSFAANATDHTTNIGSVTGVSATTVSAGSGGLTFAATGIVDMVPVTASHASTVTINANAGVATLTGYTTAAAASETVTITNSVCTETSAILISASNLGANDAQMQITRIKQAAGSFVATVKNVGGAALNGNLVLTFWIIAA